MIGSTGIRPKGGVRIRIVSQYFSPDIAVTGQLLAELAEGFRETGIDTEVLTAMPTYDRRISAERRLVREGLTVRRLPSARLDKNTRLGKVLNALTFFGSALAALVVSRSDSPLLIVSNPPFLPLVGFILKKLRGVEFLYLVHDIYPDIAVKLRYLAPGGWTERFWHTLNRLILGSASHIIVLSESMRRIIETKIRDYGLCVPPERISVVYNWADGDFIRPRPLAGNPFVARYDLEGKFIVQYSGNLGLFHDLECVLEAAQQIQDPDCVFLFIGDGGKKKKLESIARESGLQNVLFLPYQDRSRLPSSLTAAHLSIVTLEQGIEGLAMPSKLATITAAGIPVVAFCDEGSDIARIIQEAGCGVSLRQGDVAGFLTLIRELKADPARQRRMGENARLYFEGHFTFLEALTAYRRIVSAVAGGDDTHKGERD